MSFHNARPVSKSRQSSASTISACAFLATRGLFGSSSFQVTLDGELLAEISASCSSACAWVYKASWKSFWSGLGVLV